MSETTNPVELDDFLASRLGKRVGEPICRELMGVVERLSCPAGESLYEEGDHPEGLYLVLGGQLKLIRSGPGYKEHIVHLAERYSMFGEAALFLPAHPVTCTALEDSEVAFLPREPFLEVMDRNPALQRYIFEVMALWMQLLVEKIDQLTLCDGAQRLAHYLVDLHEKSPYADYVTSAQVELPTRKRDLATMLNMNQPSLSRILRQFQDEALIEVRGRRLVLKDLEALRAMTRLPRMHGGVVREDPPA